jgi:hypothetical protein
MPARKKRADVYVLLTGVEIVAVTEKAVLLEWKEHDEVFEAWVPRSVCTDGASLEKGGKDVATALWFAEQDGLPYDT